MSDAHEEAVEAVAAATPHHEKLKPFEGTFDAQVEMQMGPDQTMKMTGTIVNEFDLGGRFLRQTFHGDVPEDAGPFGAFEGRGWWGYNNVTGEYEGFWIDTASTMMQTESGTLDEPGNVWTMTGENVNPATGKPMQKRSVITLVDDDHHTMETYFDIGDGEFKAMTIRYDRAG